MFDNGVVTYKFAARLHALDEELFAIEARQSRVIYDWTSRQWRGNRGNSEGLLAKIDYNSYSALP